MKNIYRVIFYSYGKQYEVYTKSISQSEVYGFVEIGELIFSNSQSLVVDPSEEKLKQEFMGVKSSLIPMHSIVRIDEVEKEGTAKIKEVGKNGDNIAQFPTNFYNPESGRDK